MSTITVKCMCGFTVEGVETEAKAQRIADMHEARNVRRAYAHDVITSTTDDRNNTRLVYAC